MTATWMLYSLLTGALLAGAAWGVEGICRLAGRPARWAWAGAMALTLALAALAPGRLPAGPPTTEELLLVTDVAGEVAPAPAPAPGFSLGRARLAVESALRGALAAAGGYAPRGLGIYLAALWAASAAVLLAVIGSTHHRFLRRRRSWPTSELHGTRARVTPDLGPAVVGVGWAEIVVPRWFLELPARESRLVLEHEREHLHARDPLLLTLGWTAAALLAWNPAVWWMLSRLRLAVELDCDARVLSGGADRLSYGTVLIELAGRSTGLRPGMLALADPPSQLERRLLAMTSRRARFASARAAVLGTLAGTALLAACAAELPTAAQIQALDVARAEQAAGQLSIATDDATIYTLDGTVVTAAQARAVPPERIAYIAVTKAGTSVEAPRVVIATKPAEAGRPPFEPAAPAEAETVRVAPSATAGSVTAVRVTGPAAQGPLPVILVDGERRHYDALTTPFGDLPPREIESVTVIKDPRRAIELVGPDGVNGLIVVRTKNGPLDGLDLQAAPREPERVPAP